MKRLFPAIHWAASMFAFLLCVSCSKDPVAHPKVIVVGFDGMDPRLSERMMDDGLLPNLAKMRTIGGYKRLGTSIPPQSPVAWSNFITGANPGVHGIFDFIHRDAKHQCLPYYSAAKTQVSEEGWDVGDHRIPLTFWPFNHNPTQTLLRREGVPFWYYLDAAGVPVRIYDIPSNYPPSPSPGGHVCCLSGMGVPDLLGGYGTYQHFSDRTAGFRHTRNEPGGMRHPILFEKGQATATLLGPVNSYLKKPVDTNVAFTVNRHTSEPWVRIDLQGVTFVLKQGEWSDWLKVDFELVMPPFLPNAHAKGICRFYLQNVHPDFRLYVTPINIDPSDPAGQIVSEPPEFVETISDELGLFYTAGFQEDHKALSNEIFDDAEYFAQASYVLGEREELLRYATDHYEDGLLFFYFSSTDLQAHMFWWDSDDPHPTRSPEQARKYQQVIEDLYVRADGIVGDLVDRFGDEATILVMSDHGFCNFRREFNLNTWLRDNGYIKPGDCKSLLDPRNGLAINWRRTKAYALGLNGIYLNLRGRERDGIVEPGERDALLEDIRAKLLAVRDPIDGAPAIAKVYRNDEVYKGPFADRGPDLIVGFHRGFRASWATTLGDMTDQVFADNSSAWSADHCIAAEEVPGVIFSNKALLREEPSLIDLAPTILEAFDVEPGDAMEGGSLFRSREKGKVAVAPVANASPVLPSVRGPLIEVTDEAPHPSPERERRVERVELRDASGGTPR